jgi:hypothetical protein
MSIPGALVLDARETPVLALKAHTFGLAQAHPVEGAVGTGGQRLGQHRIQVLGQPADAQLPCELVKGVLGKAVPLPQGSPPLLLLGAGDGTGRLPGRIGFHAAQTLLPCGEHGVIELPSHFQVGAQACSLPGLGHQRQLEQKRRRLRFGRLALLSVLVPHQPCSLLQLERLFQV